MILMRDTSKDTNQKSATLQTPFIERLTITLRYRALRKQVNLYWSLQFGDSDSRHPRPGFPYCTSLEAYLLARSQIVLREEFREPTHPTSLKVEEAASHCLLHCAPAAVLSLVSEGIRIPSPHTRRASCCAVKAFCFMQQALKSLYVINKH